MTDPEPDRPLRLDEEAPSFASEVAGFLRETRKWWLIPILIALAIIAGMVAISASSVGPFVYTLF